ncbi:DEAD/DEAH box helicase [uncultured Williamsia sp.]|uniref:DEAD/DEAH box helicase n=1 Tax=uncultured Williamsia sp. TaxID=259311 RepID=UPI00263996B6|nr:DEAD/DEAH box helicase [uncultured Williamsia sp.]
MTTNFSDLGVPAPLVSALAADGKTQAFPIQTDTLPDALSGRDVLGRGRTGSGKTLAFAIPLVARISADGVGPTRRRGRPRALVLAPTRELATQIAAVIEPLASSVGLRLTTIFGGVNQKRQVDALNGGVDVVVACPGRLEDLMGQGHLTLDDIEVTVIDEADHMADLGFLPVVTRILGRTPRGGQRLLFSATLDNGVDALVKRFLDQPVLHSVDEANSPVEAMTHHVFQVPDTGTKTDVVEALAGGTGRRILFMRTKHQAKKLAKKLTASGIPAVDLHGNLSQAARDRNLAAFGDGSVRVLVATDVAARGVHVDDVELVIHVDPPSEHKAYLHRSGRTARAGASGDVVTIALPEQRGDLTKLLRRAGIRVDITPVTAGSRVLTDLVGDQAERIAPPPVTVTHTQSRPASAGNRSGSGRRRGARGGGAGRAGASARSGGGGHSAGGSGRSGGSSRSGGATRGRGQSTGRSRTA